MATPTIGRFVHYTLTDDDAATIASRRTDLGVGGNAVQAGDIYPAVVVRTFGGPAVNLQVLLDGWDTYWAHSRCEGDEAGHWHWPPRVDS